MGNSSTHILPRSREVWCNLYIYTDIKGTHITFSCMYLGVTYICVDYLMLLLLVTRVWRGMQTSTATSIIRYRVWRGMQTSTATSIIGELCLCVVVSRPWYHHHCYHHFICVMRHHVAQQCFGSQLRPSAVKRRNGLHHILSVFARVGCSSVAADTTTRNRSWTQHVQHLLPT